MTVTTRMARHARPLDGPFVATAKEIVGLNVVFSEAFTERYRRDGLVGVRVPPLNPAIWQYAIEDAGDGALYWRDERENIAAFNMVHQSGAEGWMGPLCVRPDRQGSGVGKTIVLSGVSLLKRRNARVVGLETMPRTMDNIGFYAALGFVPSFLTVTLSLDAAIGDHSPVLLSRLFGLEKEHAIDACKTLTERVQPGYDFTRELDLTDKLSLGDTVLLGDPRAPTGFAVFHTVPLVEGRSRDELRVLKLVLEQRSDLPRLVGVLTDHARRVGTRRVAIRLQGDYPDAFRSLVALGAQVRWTDLRMNMHGSTEQVPVTGMVLSNWEI